MHASPHASPGDGRDSRRATRPRRGRWITAVALSIALSLLFAAFPGRRFGLAFTLATGIGRAALQQRIDALEARAIAGAAFDTDDKRFLSDFYRTLARGGRLVVFARQTGRMMDHYLDGSGRDYRLDPAIFAGNAKVRAQMAALRGAMAAQPRQARAQLGSPLFYMPDRSQADSVYGLYYGRVRLLRECGDAGACRLRWRAEVPWEWPSYDSLRRKYGDPHAESFPLPNFASALLGRRYALYVDNGLGEHLARIGLAKPFLAYAEWDEPAAPR